MDKPSTKPFYFLFFDHEIFRLFNAGKTKQKEKGEQKYDNNNNNSFSSSNINSTQEDQKIKEGEQNLKERSANF